MRGSQRGAHHLLQGRTTVRSDELRGSFARWYPRMTIEKEDTRKAGSPPLCNGFLESSLCLPLLRDCLLGFADLFGVA
jgi:hypothetical protein